MRWVLPKVPPKDQSKPTKYHWHPVTMGTFVKTKFWLRIGVKNDQTSRLCQIFLHYFTLRIIFALQISVSLFKFVISYSFENEIHKYMDIDLRVETCRKGFARGHKHIVPGDTGGREKGFVYIKVRKFHLSSGLQGSYRYRGRGPGRDGSNDAHHHSAPPRGRGPIKLSGFHKDIWQNAYL